MQSSGHRQQGHVPEILSTKEEVRAAIVETVGLANRGLTILTPDLEPDIYDHDDFLNALKTFVLARSFARVRVLISDPTRAIKNGNQFVDMGRRLNSYIEFRNARPEFRDQPDAYCIADDHAIVYRARAERWDGMSIAGEPAIVKHYLDQFEEIWNACELTSQQRMLQL